jgi:hypothetical protein
MWHVSCPPPLVPVANVCKLHKSQGLAALPAVKKDTDDDNINDYVEMFGVKSPNGLGGADNSLIMPYRGAVQHEQDLFITVNYMQADPTIVGEPAAGHMPNAALAGDLAGGFEGDFGYQNRLIHPHFEVNLPLLHHALVGYGPCTPTLFDSDAIDFYSRKTDPVLNNPLMFGVYHFVLAGHALSIPTASAPTKCKKNGASGLADILGDDVIISLQNSETVPLQRGTYTHEIGHNLALTHNDNESNAGKNSCRHTSVMNYRYQFPGANIPAGGPISTGDSQAIRRHSYSLGTCAATGCATSCVNKCIPNGALTPKAACVTISNTDPNPSNPTIFVSNGTCDCDVSEWMSVNLRFAGMNIGPGDPAGADPFGNMTFPWAPGETASSILPYLTGDGSKLKPEHRRVGQRKRDFLLSLGMRDGVDFVTNPYNGKMYAQ